MAHSYKQKLWYRILLLLVGIGYIAGVGFSYAVSVGAKAYTYYDYFDNDYISNPGIPFHWYWFMAGIATTAFIVELVRSVVIWLITGKNLFNNP